MCGFTARACRTSRAEFWSLNASAAVLSVPITFASAFRSCICSFLKRYTPYSANAMLATHKAANVLIMIRCVILRRSESLRGHCMSAVPDSIRTGDRASGRKQFRADFRPGAAGCADVNGKPRALSLHHQLNHSVGLDEMVHVRNGHTIRAMQ